MAKYEIYLCKICNNFNSQKKGIAATEKQEIKVQKEED